MMQFLSSFFDEQKVQKNNGSHSLIIGLFRICLDRRISHEKSPPNKWFAWSYIHC